jgi:hypothetical protein
MPHSQGHHHTRSPGTWRSSLQMGKPRLNEVAIVWKGSCRVGSAAGLAVSLGKIEEVAGREGHPPRKSTKVLPVLQEHPPQPAFW